MSDKKYLSISQLNMLSRCGEQYYQRYILGKILPPGMSLLVGKAVDRTVTRNLQHKLEKEPLGTIEEVSDVAVDSFNDAWGASEVALTDDELREGIELTKGKAIDKSVRLSCLHASEMAPAIEPTHLQRKVEVELTGYPYDLLGFIDIQEGSKSIRDTKTSGKTPPADIADKDDQLTVYAMMASVIDGVIPEDLCLDYLIDIKTPKAQTFSTKRERGDFNPILRRVEVASDALEKGVFIPARETDWWCNEKWCGYHSTCKYVKHSRRLKS